MQIKRYTWLDPKLYTGARDCVAETRRLLTCAGLDTLEVLAYLGAVQVVFSQRMVRTAGTANYRTHRVTLNARMFMHYPEAMLPTFLHEIAHLLAYRLYAHRGHGKRWQQLMLMLGQQPQRCHRLDVRELVRAHRSEQKQKRTAQRNVAVVKVMEKAALHRRFLETTRQLRQMIADQD